MLLDHQEMQIMIIILRICGCVFALVCVQQIVYRTKAKQTEQRRKDIQTIQMKKKMCGACHRLFHVIQSELLANLHFNRTNRAKTTETKTKI